MAFRKGYIERFIPFKKTGIAHDQLIGLFAEWDKCALFVDKFYILHRIHKTNVTRGSRSVIRRVYFRFRMLYDFLVCYSRSI